MPADMSSDTSSLTIPAKDGGSFNAYMALPRTVTQEGKTAPCIIVIQEIFGINEGLRAKCDWLASHGFIACAPDLFWRIEPGIELSDQVPEELERAFELFGQFDIDKGIEDLKATKHALTGHAQSTGKIGCLGYCLGGKLAYLMACHSSINASVSYYGVGIEELLADAQSMSHPLMMHIAEEDGFVPKEAQEKIHAELQDNSYVSIHSYPGMDHAFTREGGDNYDGQQAKIADERSIDFLTQNLAD